MTVLVVVEDSFSEAIDELTVALILNKLSELAKVMIEGLEKSIIRLGMEKFAIMNPVVIWLQNPLNFFSRLVDVFKVMFPGEMDAERITMLERTQGYEVHLDAANLGNLHVVAEQVALMVKIKQCIKEVIFFDKELRLDLVTGRRRRQFRLEVVYFLVPHTEA